MKPKLLLALAMLASLGACKRDTPADPAYLHGCDGAVAQLQVGEGFMALLCGCNEGNGVIVVQGGSATCTVALGTRVIFNFSGVRNRHQIVGEGTPYLGASTVIDPSQAGHYPLIPFVATLPATGSYAYRDAFNAAVFGQIVVQ